MNVPVFSVSPDPTCMYLTPKLRDGVAKIRRAIKLRQGLSCIFGNNGYGKSSLLRHLAAALAAEPENRVAMVAESTDAARFGFLRMICNEYNLGPQRSGVVQLAALKEYLCAQFDEGHNCVILIDEAQLLRLENLEAIRSLLNFETDTAKFCQVVLAGQLELRDKMLRKRYKAFRSRIVAPVVLEYFAPRETQAMIDYRHMYWGVENRFTEEAVQCVHDLSKGVPRDIVMLCGYAYSETEQSGRAITADDITRAAGQLLLRSAREAAA